MSDQVICDLSNFPKAAEFINAVLSQKYRVIIYGGAIRGGKSFNAIAALCLMHKRFPWSRSAIVRDVLPTLKDNTYPTCEKAIPKSFVSKFKGDHYHWTFTNKSQMFFFPESIDRDPNLDRWNGLEVNFILLEQIEELRKDTFEKALERVGSYFIPEYRGNQPEPLVIVTLNPTDTWSRQEFYDRYENGTLPENWLYIPALIDDNPHVPESFKKGLEELKRVNPVKYERFVKGDWDAIEKTGNDFYTGFKRHIHVKKVDFIPDLPIHVTLDFNVLPYMTMICIQYVRQGNRVKIRVFKEYCLADPFNNVKSVCRQFVSDYMQNPVDLFYYGDASGKNRIPGKGNDYAFKDLEEELARYLNSRSDQVVNRNLNVFKRRDFMNELLSGVHSVDIEVDEGCTFLIKDLDKLKTGVDGKLKVRVKDPKTGATYEELGHTSDAFEYFVSAIFYDKIVGTWY